MADERMKVLVVVLMASFLGACGGDDSQVSQIACAIMSPADGVLLGGDVVIAGGHEDVAGGGQGLQQPSQAAEQVAQPLRVRRQSGGEAVAEGKRAYEIPMHTKHALGTSDSRQEAADCHCDDHASDHRDP